MSLLYISEYSTYGVDPNSGAAVGKEPALDQAPISIGVSATLSAAFSPRTRLIRVHTDAICSIAFGTPTSNPPAATVANKRLAANQTEYFAVHPGDQLSVIANT